MALPSSGTISLVQVRDEFRPGQSVLDLRSYYKDQGIIGNNPENNNIPYDPTYGPISLSQFHGAARSSGGTWDQSTPGYYEIWVPSHAWLLVQAWGGGGGGVAQGAHGYAGNGGNSIVNGYVQADGGTGAWGGGTTSSAGAGGAGWYGNQSNLTGGNGTHPNGGAGANGGAGGTGTTSGTGPGGAGAWPGGGGGGAIAHGGGGGGYAYSSYGPGYGRTIAINVGDGGAALDGNLLKGGRGAAGRVLIQWGV